MAATQREQEIRVGIFVLVAIALMLVFAAIMGVFNPFKSPYKLSVNYSFAGGILTGSPVRISGITVGKVEKIKINTGKVDSDGIPTPVELVLNIDPKVKESVRGDSEFFINLAGLIGEKYLEITPGSPTAELIAANSQVRGVDPPRIDQLLSQSFGLAGDIRKLLKSKEGSIKDTIELMIKLTRNLNKLFDSINSQKNITSQKLDTLFNNLVKISSDLRVITDRMDSPEGQKVRQVLYDILLRLEKVDETAVRNFLQKEGVKTRVAF